VIRLKPFLTLKHRRAKKQWASDNVGRDWRRVVSTDQAIFELGKPRRSWTTRRAGEELTVVHGAPLSRSARQSAMVWGSIAHGKRFPLFFTLDQSNLMNVSSRSLDPFPLCLPVCSRLGRCPVCGGYRFYPHVHPIPDSSGG